MNAIAPQLTVFSLGIVTMWLAIPLGLAFQLRPSQTILLTILGASTGTLAVLFLGAGIRRWLPGRCKKLDPADEGSLVRRIWLRYGVVGLGFLAPLVTGIPLGTALALSLGGRKRIVAACMFGGIVFWSVVLTFFAELGAAILGLG